MLRGGEIKWNEKPRARGTSPLGTLATDCRPPGPGRAVPRPELPPCPLGGLDAGPWSWTEVSCVMAQLGLLLG